MPNNATEEECSLFFRQGRGTRTMPSVTLSRSATSDENTYHSLLKYHPCNQSNVVLHKWEQSYRWDWPKTGFYGWIIALLLNGGRFELLLLLADSHCFDFSNLKIIAVAENNTSLPKLISFHICNSWYGWQVFDIPNVSTHPWSLGLAPVTDHGCFGRICLSGRAWVLGWETVGWREKVFHLLARSQLTRLKPELGKHLNLILSLRHFIWKMIQPPAQYQSHSLHPYENKIMISDVSVKWCVLNVDVSTKGYLIKPFLLGKISSPESIQQR